MTEAELLLLNCALKIEIVSRDETPALEAFNKARSTVIRERFGVECKEQARALFNAQRDAADAWDALNIPRCVVEEWYPEFRDERAERLGLSNDGDPS